MDTFMFTIRPLWNMNPCRSATAHRLKAMKNVIFSIQATSCRVNGMLLSVYTRTPGTTPTIMALSFLVCPKTGRVNKDKHSINYNAWYFWKWPHFSRFNNSHETKCRHFYVRPFVIFYGAHVFLFQSLPQIKTATFCFKEQYKPFIVIIFFILMCTLFYH